MRVVFHCAWAALAFAAVETAAAAEPLASAAVPTAQKATERAAELAATLNEKGLLLGPPRLFDQEHGLAVDRSDPKDARVIAFVGPSWLVPAQADPAPAKPGLVIDRGTGLLVGRAHDIVPMPRPGVCYVEGFQLPANALGQTDAVQMTAWGMGDALSIRLDLGGGTFATMNVQPAIGGNILAGANPVKIQFGNGMGRMIARQVGGNTQLTAVSDDGSLMASCYSQKGGAKLEERFKDILRGLTDRPEQTRIWPADARPWITGIAGWGPAPSQLGNVGMWSPQEKVARPGVVGVAVTTNIQVFVAAKVLHPYELPPAILGDGLGTGKLLSARPAVLGGWVGSERTMEVQGPAQFHPGQYFGPQPAQVKQIPYQARVLDLHRDVRRLMVRCQAPKEQYEKWAGGFEGVLKDLKTADEPMEPVVVPLDPASYRPGKK